MDNILRQDHLQGVLGGRQCGASAKHTEVVPVRMRDVLRIFSTGKLTFSKMAREIFALDLPVARQLDRADQKPMLMEAVKASEPANSTFPVNGVAM